MTDVQEQAPPQPSGGSDTSSTANVIYILYLVAVVIGITAIVGVIMAYVNRGDAPGWLASHYRWQIRTFWIGLLYSVICTVTTVIVVGWLLLVVVLVWWVVRCAKGMKYLGQKQPMPDETTWIV